MGTITENLSLISVILTTRNRTIFRDLACLFFQWQNYPVRELIIVDDSDEYVPLPLYMKDKVVHIRMAPAVSLGTKLNYGIERATGTWILKMDADDYYASTFLTTMADSAFRTKQSDICFGQPFLFFDLCRWQIRLADPDRCSGATLFFSREYWQACPFRDQPKEVDADFLLDHLGNRRTWAFQPVNTAEQFLQVRHTNHIWNEMPDGKPMERYLASQELYSKRPEQVIPRWLVDRYRTIRAQIIGVNK